MENKKNKLPEINKISDWEWRIEKQGQMNVPLVIFASEKLLEGMKGDRTLIQGMNVASLPGVQKQAMIMPDGHEGYGFPIGGVAGLDVEKGGISPGGVGYDINCLPSDTKILTKHGCYKKICDFEKDFVEIENTNHNFKLKTKLINQQIISFDWDNQELCNKPISFFMKKQHNGEIYKLTSELGYNIKATAEHPILTKEGMIQIDSIDSAYEIAINPFEGVEYEEIKNEEILINEEEFLGQQKKFLKEKGLLPLTTKNSKLPLLTKLFGFLLGDGNIYISNGKGYVNAYGSIGDLETIKNDLKELGCKSLIHVRERKHTIKDQYSEKKFNSINCELHCSSTSLANLFFKLGYPKGTKTNTDYLVPEWIMKSPNWIKRLFLAGLFGAELTTPKTITKTCFSCPVLSMNKNKNHLENGREFMIQIMKLLEELDIKVDKIQERNEHKNRFGKTCRLRININSRTDNLIKLWSKIGFEYNKKRELISKIAIMYLKKKKILNNKRISIAKQVKEYKNKGLKLKEIQKLLVSKITNSRFIERHYYEKAKQRIPLNFISFEEYLKEKIKEYEKYGLLFDKVKSVKTESFNDEVYDFTIPKTHNFIANNVIVSNCGVRLLKTNLKENQVRENIREVLVSLFKNVPSGLGSSNLKISLDDLNEVLEKGAAWAVENGYGNQNDLDNCESKGCMKEADSSVISQRAKARGRKQLGSLGAGNHFLEVQVVDEVYDEEIAKAFGLEKGSITIMIHCGSRGLGHQVCSDYLREIENKLPEIVAKIPDKEIVYAPSHHPLCSKYYSAMASAANFAWCNRHMIGHYVRKGMKEIFADFKADTLYDVAHNICKIEEHEINGEKKKLYVHRKGATRAFGPGREELNEKYRKTGQPILLPGSMGTASYVLVGTKESENVSFASTAHGAGRCMSRRKAMDTFKSNEVERELNKNNIYVKSASKKGIVQEAPGVYKDIDEVAKVSDKTGIGKLVVRVRPIGVVKG